MKKVRLGTTKVGENVYEIKIVGRGPKAIKVSRIETIDGYTDEYTDFINNADVYGDNENYLALKSCAKHSFDDEIVEYIETPLFNADMPGGIDREAEKAWALSQIEEPKEETKPMPVSYIDGVSIWNIGNVDSQERMDFAFGRMYVSDIKESESGRKMECLIDRIVTSKGTEITIPVKIEYSRKKADGVIYYVTKEVQAGGRVAISAVFRTKACDIIVFPKVKTEKIRY